MTPYIAMIPFCIIMIFVLYAMLQDPLIVGLTYLAGAAGIFVLCYWAFVWGLVEVLK